MSEQDLSRRAGKALHPVPGIWRAIAGFIVWSIAFVVLYVGHAVACLYVPSTMQAATVSVSLAALWAVHVGACAALAWHSGSRWPRLRAQADEPHVRFMWRATFLIDATALGAVIVTGLPVLAFPACSA